MLNKLYRWAKVAVALSITFAAGSIQAKELSFPVDHRGVPHERNCGTMHVLQEQLNADPTLAARMEEMETKLQARIAETEQGGAQVMGATGYIPLVVHVIYNSAIPAQNISDAQIASQVSVLNKDYSSTNPDFAGVPAEFQPYAANGGTGISFQLVATTRKASTRVDWGTNDDMKKSSTGGVDAWDPSQYLNMWICNIGGGILGYAQFPGTGTPATDGVVFSPGYCGSSDYGSFFLDPPFDKGRTATHEIGHYLNLRHIWGDGRCAADYVTDTPKSAASNYGCPAPLKSCSSNADTGAPVASWTRDQTMNYMDYTDDACMYMFSAGQRTRMNAAIDTYRATLADGNPTTGGGGGGGGTGTGITAESESNGTVGTADGPMGNGTAVSGAIAKSDLDYFYFNTSASGSITITLNISGSVDLDMYLYNSTGTTEVARAYTTSNPEVITYNAAAGKYYLKVKAYKSTSTGSYTVKVSGTNVAREIPGDQETAAKSFGLHNNFPNPVSKFTTIGYQLPNEANVSLRIYNAVGQLVKTLVNANQSAGSHSINWDGRNDDGLEVATGTYFYQVTAGDLKQTKRMQVIR